MKAKPLIFLFLIGIMITFYGCQPKSKDYRDKYIGKWVFEVNTSSYGMSPGNSSSDNYTHVGSIIWGENPDEIVVDYNPDGQMVLKINEQGELLNSGAFTTFNITENNFSFFDKAGGMGGGITINITGEKE